MDPPYYDNVMYAELADFFYVWEKRALGTIWPELFRDDLTNKQNEAVANPALFAAEGRGAKAKADSDYTQKMGAIFKEVHRVLADDGVLTVMFTHKRVDAWDSLGTALLGSGFTIETSWPVRTESEQSLHQARSNSAASTIFLVCRKRPEALDADPSRTTYLVEIDSEIRRKAGEAYDRSVSQGLREWTFYCQPTARHFRCCQKSGLSIPTKRTRKDTPGLFAQKKPWPWLELRSQSGSRIGSLDGSQWVLMPLLILPYWPGRSSKQGRCPSTKPAVLR